MKGKDRDLRVEDVANTLNCTPANVRELLNAGRLQGYRLRHSWRVTRAALEALRSGGDVAGRKAVTARVV
jgi:excisionase family DNA binding protein